MTETFMETKNAIALITRFPKVIAQSGREISLVPHGPWKISISCSHEDELFGEAKTEDYEIDISFQEEKIFDILKQVEKDARQFLTAFQVIHEWLETDISNFSSQLNQIFLSSQNTQNQIRDGVNVETSTIINLTNSIEKTLNHLQGTFEKLDQGMSALETYSEQQMTYEEIIEVFKDSLKQIFQDTLNHVKSILVSKPCGQADALNQLSHFQSQFSSTVDILSEEFSELTEATEKAKVALSILKDTVLDFTWDYKESVAQISTANNIEALCIETVNQEWQSLAEYTGKRLTKFWQVDKILCPQN